MFIMSTKVFWHKENVNETVLTRILMGPRCQTTISIIILQRHQEVYVVPCVHLPPHSYDWSHIAGLDIKNTFSQYFDIRRLN